MRGRGCLDQCAVGRKGCDRRLGAGEEICNPLGERKLGASLLGRRDQDRVGAIAQLRACAAAGQRSLKAGPKSAQALEAARIIIGEGGRKPRDLCCHIAALEATRLERCGCLGAQNRRAGRVGKEDPCAVERPGPGWPRSERQRSQARIAQPEQPRVGLAHQMLVHAPARESHLCARCLAYALAKSTPARRQRACATQGNWSHGPTDPPRGRLRRSSYNGDGRSGQELSGFHPNFQWELPKGATGTFSLPK